MKLKQINELVDGQCTVVTEDGERYYGMYNSHVGKVFFTIPEHKEILGYLQ